MSRGSSNTANRGKRKAPTQQRKGSGKSRERLLNAFAIASKQTSEHLKLPRNRAGKLDDRDNNKPAKRARDAEDRHEKVATSKRGHKDSRPGHEEDRDVEGGSDGEGNEWRMGEVDSQDDSELDSDEALGESDEERFEGFTFRGSSSMQQGPSKRRRLSPPDGNLPSLDEVDELSEDSDVQDEASWAGFDDEEFENGVDVSNVPDATKATGQDRLLFDLATALDDGGQDTGESATASDTESDGSGDDDDAEAVLSISDEEQGRDHDPSKLFALQNLIRSMNPDGAKNLQRAQQTGSAVELEAPTDFGVTSSRKLTVEDLLPSVTDPTIKKSLRLLSSTGGGRKSGDGKGVPGKLDPPLARRQQDRLDRAAAYKKSKETLERWLDTIKHLRRADHIQFPIIGLEGKGARPAKEVLPRSEAGVPNELESTIQQILQESGLDAKNADKDERNIQALEEEHMRQMSAAEAHARQARLRMTRELLFREEIRAKRLKKIKSKSFRRVHRKEREKNEEKTRSALVAGGFVDVEAERERMDRRRAEERMGAKHRQSKWAKGVKAGGRQKWDEEARLGMVEMAQRDEELRRRIEGKVVEHGADIVSESSDDESADADSDGEGGQVDAREKLRRSLDDLQGQHVIDNNAPVGKSGLSSLKFMQKAEAARKAENDALAEQMKRELAGEDVLSDEGPSTIGRRTYEPKPARDANEKASTRDTVNEFEERLGSEDESDNERPVSAVQSSGLPQDATEMPPFEGQSRPAVSDRPPGPKAVASLSAKQPSKLVSKSVSFTGGHAQTPSNRPSAEGHHDEAKSSRKQNAPKTALQGHKKGLAPRRSTAQADTSTWTALDVAEDEASTDGEASTSKQKTKGVASLSQAELRRRAFGGDEVDATFEAEKEELAKDEDDQVIDNTLPGWGHWVGDGIRKGPQNRFLTTVEGVKKEKRADAKLPRVIISEKRIKKNAKYLAPSLPHPFESQQQYERSLRLPMGPEWTTRETFQAATKPRILIKQGIISPLENPFL